MSFEFLMMDQNFAFTVAFLVVLGLGLIELAGLALGAGLSDMIGSVFPSIDLELEMPDAAEQSSLGSVLAWLRVGEVPIVVLFIILLMSFAITGLVIQLVVGGLLGFLLPSIIAMLVAFILALPITRWGGGILHKYMPKDETYAVSSDSFIGREAQIVLGVAKKGQPAQAKLTDEHGKVHYLMVQPDMEDEEFKQADRLLIVRQETVNFFAIRA